MNAVLRRPVLLAGMTIDVLATALETPSVLSISLSVWLAVDSSVHMQILVYVHSVNV